MHFISKSRSGDGDISEVGLERCRMGMGLGLKGILSTEVLRKIVDEATRSPRGWV
jgi:hypothetical protein